MVHSSQGTYLEATQREAAAMQAALFSSTQEIAVLQRKVRRLTAEVNRLGSVNISIEHIRDLEDQLVNVQNRLWLETQQTAPFHRYLIQQEMALATIKEFSRPSQKPAVKSGDSINSRCVTFMAKALRNDSRAQQVRNILSAAKLNFPTSHDGATRIPLITDILHRQALDLGDEI